MQQPSSVSLEVLVADAWNVVEEKRDRTDIESFAGVFWETKNMNDAKLILKYREKAGEDSISRT